MNEQEERFASLQEENAQLRKLVQGYHSSGKSTIYDSKHSLDFTGVTLMVELQNLYSLVASHIRSYLELIGSNLSFYGTVFTQGTELPWNA